MKIETQPLDGHQVKITAEIDNERLEETKRKAASKLARQIKIPGFRPGKAPYPVVQKTVGDAAIFEEALEILIDQIYPEVIEEAEIRPYGPGRLDKIAEKDPLKLEFIVSLDAEVILGDYKSIRKPYEPEPVSEGDIIKTLEELRENMAVILPVERPAQEGDLLMVNLSGYAEKDGKEEPLIDNKSIPILIKSAQEREWPFLGFSMQLVGKNVGDKGAADFTMPKDYPDEYLREAPAHLNYEVENIKARTLPELNDEFASSVGDFETLAALRADITAKLNMKAEEDLNRTYDNEIIDLAVEQSDFKYSDEMFENELDQVIREFTNSLKEQEIDLDIYLKSRKMDEKALREELKPSAEARLKRSLLLLEIGKKENIKVEREELETEAGSRLRYLQYMLPEKQSRQLNKPDVQHNIVNNVLVDLLTRKTIERLRDYARGQVDDSAAIESETEEQERSNIEPENKDSNQAQTESITGKTD